MTNRLEVIAQNAARTSGIEHKVMIGHLRVYLRAHPEATILKEIDELTDKGVFNSLVEAGLRQPFQDALLLRWVRI